MYLSNLLLFGSVLFSGDQSGKCLQRIMEEPVVVIQAGPENFRNFEDSQKPKTYLITWSSDTNLQETLQKWSEIEAFNPRARFWIFTNTASSRIFKILSKFYIVNVALVTQSNQVYSYVPYKEENLTNPDLTPLHMGSCQNANPFFQKLPKSWTNTTIKILTKCIAPYVECSDKGRSTGLEMQILDLIQKNLKFGTEHVKDDSVKFGLVKNNGTYSASFGCLQERKVDMAMGGFRSVGHTQYRDFDFATNHLEDRLIWVVPKAFPLVHWMRIVKIFEWRVWLTLIILTFVVGKIFEAITKWSGEASPIFQKFSMVVSFKLLIGGYLKTTPQKLEMKIIFIFWIYFCMIFNIIFNSNLMTVFFGNFETFQVDSFEDIVKSRLDVGLIDDVMHVVKDDPDWPALKRKRDVFICPFGTACLNRTINQRDLACCWGRRSITYVMAKSYKTSVHFIDDHLVYYLVLFYFVKGYPLVPQISHVINQLKAAGLVQHFSSRTKKLEPPVMDQSKVLTFKRLEGPFYLVLFGWFIAFLIFLGELIYHARTEKRRKYAIK